MLVSKGLISKERMAELKKLAKDRAADLAQTILLERALSLAQLGEVFREQYQIDWVDLAQTRVDPAAARLIPDPIMREQRLLAFEQTETALRVAMADPRNDNLRDRLQIMTGKTIVPYLADETAIAAAQRRYTIDAPGLAGAPARPQDLEEMAGRETTVRMVDQILESAIRGHATDIHLEPQANHLRVRYRIDGMLHDFLTLPTDAGTPVLSRLKILSNMDITERRRPQDGRMTATIGERVYHFRASTLPTTMGEKLALRILPDASLMMGMQELGLDEAEQVKLDRALARTHGMILVTGPIGSGKTTTLYNMLQTKNRHSTNIVTIEDPVEYQLPGVNQIAVDPKLGLDFASGLRAVLRQDANVLMVGEIRDSETAQAAVRAALTGHLLFSTLHTHDTVGAIYALRHLGIQPYLIASSVVCVIAQRLLRRVCPHCRRLTAPSPPLRAMMKMPAKSKKKVPEAVGCEHCFRTGYQGRVGVFDILLLNDEIKNAIAAGAPESEVRGMAQKLGSVGLLPRGWRKVEEGATTPEEVLRVLCSEEN
ncbi:type II/IV secretion system protein [bacterium]|nr:type II/IV secretion system protein [bacterium]